MAILQADAEKETGLVFSPILLKLFDLEFQGNNADEDIFILYFSLESIKSTKNFLKWEEHYKFRKEL